MRGSNGKLCFSKKERGSCLLDYVETITNEENDCDNNVDVGAVEGPVYRVRIDEVMKELKEVKTGKTCVPLDMYLWS